MRALTQIQVTESVIWALDEDGYLWIAPLEDGLVPSQLAWERLDGPGDLDGLPQPKDRFEAVEEAVRQRDAERERIEGLPPLGNPETET